ncbi:MAG TPA: response regulator [Polyangiaceae bacterium]
MSNPQKYVVLVADDEPSTLALLGRHLRAKGYTVLEANDGDQAWELAHEHLPHLVVLDVMMPGMSGWEVCRKIREAVSLAHTGVIMLTGIGETLNEMTSPLYGADAHLDKPFEFAELDRRIEETLERRQAGALGRADGVASEDGTVTFTKPIVKAKPSLAKTSKKSAAAPKAGKAKPAAKPAKAKPEAKPAKAKPAAKLAKGKPEAKPAKVKPAKAKPAAKPAKTPAKAKVAQKPVAKSKAKAGVKAPAKAMAKPAAKSQGKAKPATKAKANPATSAKAKPPAKASKSKEVPKAKAASKALPKEKPSAKKR